MVIERSADEKDPNAPKKVTLSGAAEHIEFARGLIEEQLEEDEAFRRKQQIAADARGKKTKKKPAAGAATSADNNASSAPRTTTKTNNSDIRSSSSGNSLSGGGDVRLKDKKNDNFDRYSNSNGDIRYSPHDGSGDARASAASIAHATAKTVGSVTQQPRSSSSSSLLPSDWTIIQLPSHDGYFEVFVSANDVKDANRVWIQLTSQVEKLNHLNNQMASLYNAREGEKYRLPEEVERIESVDCDRVFAKNRLYAAKFQAFDDSKWFR